MSWTNLHFYNYVGESVRIIVERIKDHNGRDYTLHVLKNSIENSHDVNTIEFKIIDKNFDNNKLKRKIPEELWIKGLGLTLNTQEKSIQLKHFNWLRR